MNLPKLARLSVLCLILFLTAATAFAQPQGAPRCGCQLCSNSDPLRPCRVDGDLTTCGAFLAVTLCPARPPQSSAEEAFLSLTSGAAQVPAGCVSLGGQV